MLVLNEDEKWRPVTEAEWLALVGGGAGGGGGGGDASAANQATQISIATAIQTAAEAINTKTPALSGGKVPVTDPTTLPLPSGAATAANQAAGNALLGAATEAPPADDTASSGLNGRLQRIAQRLTSLISLFTPSAATSATLATNSDGVTYTAFGSQACRIAMFSNQSGIIVSVKLNGGGAVRIPTGAVVPLGVSNLNQISVQRTDGVAGASVTVGVLCWS